jgi:hypothetical protein
MRDSSYFGNDSALADTGVTDDEDGAGRSLPRAGPQPEESVDLLEASDQCRWVGWELELRRQPGAGVWRLVRDEELGSALRELAAVAGRELPEERCDMCLHRSRRHVQPLCNLRARQALGQEGKHLAFSASDRRLRRSTHITNPGVSRTGTRAAS